jgi:hypothetical protein
MFAFQANISRAEIVGKPAEWIEVIPEPTSAAYLESRFSPRSDLDVWEIDVLEFVEFQVSLDPTGRDDLV